MGYSQNALIGCIYDMALGRSSWDRILDLLAAAFPECAVTVSGDDTTSRNNLVFAQRGLHPAAVSAYVGTYAPLNPWLEAQAGLAPHQIYHDDQLLPRAESRNARFVTEWLSRQGNFEAATGVLLLREGTRQLVLEIRYAADRDDVRERAAAVLAEVAQHFGRAFEIISGSRFAVGRGYLDHVVEDLPFTVFFVDAGMRVRYMNYHADGFCRQHCGPFTTADGYLRATDEAADAELRQMVSRITQSKRSPSAALQVARPGSDDRYFAVGRLAQRETQHFQLHDAILDPGPLVMLVVHGSTEIAALPMDLLWRTFNLTESEARLAEALLSGATLADYARDRQVSKQTLRNQLVGVMRKTGTRRQPQLISLLTRLALTCL